MVMKMKVNMTRGMNVRPPSTYAYKSARKDMKICSVCARNALRVRGRETRRAEVTNAATCKCVYTPFSHMHLTRVRCSVSFPQLCAVDHITHRNLEKTG